MPFVKNQLAENWNNKDPNAIFDIAIITEFGGVSVNTTHGLLRSIFANFDYASVRNLVMYDADGGVSTARAGFTDFAKGSNPSDNRFVSNIDEGTIIYYYRDYGGNAGIAYYYLHELSHNLAQVKSFEIAMSVQYRNGHGGSLNGWEYSPEFRAVERVTNTVARALGSELGYTLSNIVPHGYYP